MAISKIKPIKKYFKYKTASKLLTQHYKAPVLVDEGDDGFSSQLFVVLPVGLQVPLVLLHRPEDHLHAANESESIGEEQLRHHAEAHPAEDLEGIVRARNQIE